AAGPVPASTRSASPFAPSPQPVSSSSWIDAFSSSATASPLASPASPWSDGPVVPGTRGADDGSGIADPFAGLQPFGFDPDAPIATPPTPPAASAANPWGTLDTTGPAAGGMGFAPSGQALAPISTESSTDGSDSPWGGAFAAALASGDAPVDDPYLQSRKRPTTDDGVDVLRGSSPALISRPPVAGRATNVATIPCPSCREMVMENALSCPRCQYRFYAPCPHCGDFIDTSDPRPGKDKCPHCEQPVDKIALGQPPTKGGRRTATGAPVSTAVAVAPLPPAKTKPAKAAKGRKADPRAPIYSDMPPPPAPGGPNPVTTFLLLLLLLAAIGFVIFFLPDMLGVDVGGHLVLPTPTVDLGLTRTP
ncbi:MAG TPA: hypothetical protein VM536_23540, partial [Chloroflexia bacterium]|nr:hypothetical protein [Chloroflexia bacterium]